MSLKKTFKLVVHRWHRRSIEHKAASRATHQLLQWVKKKPQQQKPECRAAVLGRMFHMRAAPLMGKAETTSEGFGEVGDAVFAFFYCVLTVCWRACGCAQRPEEDT